MTIVEASIIDCFALLVMTICFQKHICPHDRQAVEAKEKHVLHPGIARFRDAAQQYQ
jgi:hypothetical protein